MTHAPVLLKEITEYVAEIKQHDGWFLDGTFGRGGHARSIMKVRPDIKYLALDQDQAAVEYAQSEFRAELDSGRMEIHRANYADFGHYIEGKKICGVLLDLGVSSPQLDEGPRGFSFYKEGPLDMRMDQSQEITAASILNEWAEEDLMQLFKEYGEIHSPYKVVQKVLRRRESQPFETTQDFANLVVAAEGWRKKGHHPATNYFLALRLRVNNELEILQENLRALALAMEDLGRLFVITFHSLEDRITKNIVKALVDEGLGQKVVNKTIAPSDAEVKQNPRARSAKLRIWQKGIDEDLKSKNEKKKTSGYLKR